MVRPITNMKRRGGEVDMAQEPFLINPPKRLRKRKRNPIGETLTVIGANPMTKNPWYGNSAGHRRAALIRWGKVSRRKVRRTSKRRTGRVVYRKRGRWAPKAVRRHRMLAKHAMWATKYGEMLAHPRRKKYHYRAKGVKYYMKRIRRHSNRRRRRNTWFGQPRRHKRAAKKGWRRGHLVPFTHSRRSRRRTIRHRNPMTASANPRRRRHYNVRHRRRHSARRRNPAMMAEFGRFTSSIMNVREWAPLAITGGLSAITGAIVPGMLGVYNPWAKYGVQTAVAIGGGLVVERVVDRRHGQAWMIVGVAMVGYQLLKEFVLQPYFPQFAVGLGQYEDYYPNSAYAAADEVSQQVGAFPPSGMSAFPSGMSDYPGVGAYPYDGAGY